MIWALPRVVLARRPDAAFARALSSTGARLDPQRARAQHAAYVAAIADAGCRVVLLPPLAGRPDACFVEDPVVVTGARVLRCRSAAPSRARDGDGLPVEDHCTVHRMSTGFLDGGDVLRVGDTLWVGRSSRTDDAGIRVLSSVAGRDGLAVRTVDVPRGLHLKSACSLAGPDLLVYDPSVLDTALLPTDVEHVAALEPEGANVLALGDVTLVSASAPRTAELLARRRDVRAVPSSAFHAADGALTCLSVRIPALGTWCT